jgi:hypothetical protein
MAKVITQQKHGSVGPSTFQSTRHGTIERQRVRPIDPKTARQLDHRGLVLAVARQWGHLTDEQRAGWTDLTGRLAGQLAGQQAYVKINVTLAKCGLPQLEVAPPIPALGVPTCAGLVVDDTPRVHLTQVSGVAGADKLLIDACAPLGQGVGYVKNLWRRLTAMTAPVGTPADLDLTATYVGRFSAPQAGQRVFVRLMAMKNGMKGTALQLSAIVTAHGN